MMEGKSPSPKGWGSLGGISKGLYYNFWDRYISNIYNIKQRKYNFKVILPINIIQKLSLNDRLNINDKQYRITDFNINLLNGVIHIEM